MHHEKWTAEPQVIAPGEVVQISLKAPKAGIVKGVVLGEGANPIKLWVGKGTHVFADAERPIELPVASGGLLLVTVKNELEEPALFTALFVVECEPTVEKAPEAAGLTQKLPPEPTRTAADLGVKPGRNEIAVCFARNEAFFLLDYLRSGGKLDQVVKAGIIRRLDAEMKKG